MRHLIQGFSGEVGTIEGPQKIHRKKLYFISILLLTYYYVLLIIYFITIIINL